MDKLVELIETEAGKLQGAFLVEIARLLNTMPRRLNGAGQSVLYTDENLTKILSEVRARLTAELLLSEESRLIAETFTEGFAAIDSNVAAVHRGVNNLALTDQYFAEAAALRNSYRNVAVHFLKEANLTATFIDPVVRVFANSIELGYTYDQALREMEALLKINARVGQLARGLFFGYDGAINAKVAQDYELTAIRYTGTIVRDSRAQCRKWLRMRVLSADQVEQEIRWAKSPGASFEGIKVGGFIATTTPQNFLINRGGYNCRHRAIPVRKEEE